MSTAENRIRPLKPIEFRYLLCWYLMQDGPQTVKQLAARLEDDGITTYPRPSEAISDALRSEMVRGRAVRISRGYY